MAAHLGQVNRTVRADIRLAIGLCFLLYDLSSNVIDECTPITRRGMLPEAIGFVNGHRLERALSMLIALSDGKSVQRSSAGYRTLMTANVRSRIVMPPDSPARRP